MNPEQRSITAAFALIAGVIVWRRQWLQRFIAWMQQAPSPSGALPAIGAPVTTTGSAGPIVPAVPAGGAGAPPNG